MTRSLRASRTKGKNIDVVTLEKPESPRSSIVILAWKMEDTLLACLRSVSNSVGSEPFEVIVVLNGASEGVRNLVATSVTGATVVDIAHNVGFGGGCNAGAGVARGEFVVFLNDDTIVDPSWLMNLERAARERPDAGAVASLLLNPDGTVQEAGSRVLDGAGTVQFGRGLSLDAARETGLLVRREIDYGSAAALLVRTALFREIAGFDPAFEPAYFEDVDLQFRLRLAGGSVLFEPSAGVEHISGASTSTDSLYREWASWKNSQTFISRWHAILAQAPAADADVTELCPVSREAQAFVEDRPLSSSTEIVEGSLTTAYVLSKAYSAWLAARLTSADATVAHQQAHIERLERERRELDGKVSDLVTRVNETTHRLHDLDTRGPVGLVKWRLGLLDAKRRSRR